MRYLLMLFLISLMTSSCGQKGEVSSAKFKIFSSSIIGDPLVLFPGGLIVFGRSLDGAQSFVLPYNPGLELELKKGSWEFGTVGWMGAQIMEGQQQCSFQTIEINSELFTINFNMNYQNCVNGRTVDGSYLVNKRFYDTALNSFKTLNVSTCSSSITTCSGASQGVPVSFRVTVPLEIKGINITAGAGAGLQSRCYSGGSGAVAPPHGGVNGFIGTKITIFSDGSCILGANDYFFKNGFGKELNETILDANATAVIKRGAMSINGTTNYDAGLALAPFMGTIDPADPPIGVASQSALYYNAAATASPVSAAAGQYSYFGFDGAAWTWSVPTATSSVRLFLQL